MKLSFEDETELLSLVNDRFISAMYFHSYCLADFSTHFDEQVAKHVTKWLFVLQVQMESQLFDIMDAISNIGFLHKFKMVFDKNPVYKRPSRWLVPFFVKRKPVAALTALPALNTRWLHGSINEGIFTSRAEVAVHFMDTSTTDNIFCEGDTKTVLFTQLTNMILLQYSDAIWTRPSVVQNCRMSTY